MLSKTSRVIQSEAKNLTECSAESLHERSAEALSSGEINLPSSQPTLMLRVGGASLCRDDTITEIVMLVDNYYIISNTNGGHWRTWVIVRSVRH